MNTSKSQSIKAIITGTTGMVGEGVLHECLLSPDIEAVLVINRKPCGVIHPKLKEIIHNDFFNFSAIEHSLSGYNACFFCLGVSSVGMKEPEYYKMTYTLTMHVAETLSRLNTDMTFCYVSGAGTDATEKGRSMWARVKGKTENDLKKLPFADVYAFRPGYMHPTKGLNNTLSSYTYLKWMYPFFRAVFPKFLATLKEVGLAMISVAKHPYEKKIIDTTDIVLLAQRESAQ